MSELSIERGYLALIQAVNMQLAVCQDVIYYAGGGKPLTIRQLRLPLLYSFKIWPYRNKVSRYGLFMNCGWRRVEQILVATNLINAFII